MSATPSAGASGTKATDREEGIMLAALFRIGESHPSAELNANKLGDIILDAMRSNTQADTAALVALLKSMEWKSEAMGGFGYTIAACPFCRSSPGKGHLTDCKLQQALAKHGKDAE